jgi:F0F1-type ATP synthase membrane subunit b/b'
VLTLPNYSVFVIIACFWLVYLLVRTQIVKPLGAVLDERARIAAQAQESHETAKKSLDEELFRCERELATAAAEAARDRAAERAAGEATRRAKLDAARAQAQERMAQLTREIELAGAQARSVLRVRTAEIGHELASQLAGRRIA